MVLERFAGALNFIKGEIMKSNNSGGIGFAGLLTVLFVGLKLTGFVAWSWVWVLAPLWLPIGFVVSISLIAFLLSMIFLKEKGGK